MFMQGEVPNEPNGGSDANHFVGERAKGFLGKGRGSDKIAYLSAFLTAVVACS